MGGDHDGLGFGLQLAGGVEDAQASIGAVAGDGAEALAGLVGSATPVAKPEELGMRQVGDDDVERPAPELLDGGLHIVDDGADVARALEGVGHDVGVVGLILDDEDLGSEIGGVGTAAGHGRGSVRAPRERFSRWSRRDAAPEAGEADGHGVGDVVGLGRLGEFEFGLDGALDLGLARAAEPVRAFLTVLGGSSMGVRPASRRRRRITPRA